jgi:cytochrome c-type biogenesis protein CcmH
MKRLGEILLLCVAVALLMGADSPDTRFQKLGGKIMCTCGVCTYMLLECDHVGCPNSERMIGELHALTGTKGKGPSTQLASIKPQSNDDAVLDWFRQNWGVTAVVEPRTTGLELWAWVMPYLALFLGGSLVITTLYLWKRRRPQLSRTNTRLDPHLEALRDRARRETEI